MNTFFTSSRFIAILFAVNCATTPILAQQANHRTTTKRTTVVPKPRVTASKPTAAAKQTIANNKTAVKPAQNETAQPEIDQPKPQATVATVSTAQSAPVRHTSQSTTSRTTHSQTSPGSLRNKYLNVGVGVAAYYGAGLPLGASFEVDVKNNFSVGGSFDYLRYSGGYTFIYVGGRASYHLGDVLNVQDQKFDPYIGATLGFRHTGYDNSYGYYDYGSYNSGLYLGIHLGSRYYFSDKIGGFAEVGYGVSALKLGLAAKF